MTEFPKTYTRRRSLLTSMPILMTLGLLGILCQFIYVVLYYNVAQSQIIWLGGLYTLILVFGVYPKLEKFTLSKDCLVHAFLFRKQKIQFSDTAIWFYPIMERGYLLRDNKKVFPLDELPEEVLQDLFAVLPPSTPVVVMPRAKRETPDSPDMYASARLAAQTFRHLESNNVLKALIAKHMLGLFKKETPENTGESAERSAIIEGKSRLANEYGEMIEAYTYQLERDTISLCLFYFIMPAALLMICWLAELPAAIFLAVGIMTLCCIGPVLDRFNLLLQHKRLVRDIQTWREDFSGTAGTGAQEVTVNMSVQPKRFVSYAALMTVYPWVVTLAVLCGLFILIDGFDLLGKTLNVLAAGAVVVTPLIPVRLTFMLSQSGLKMNSWLGKSEVLFVEMSIALNPKNDRAYIMRKGKKWFPLDALPEELFSELFLTMHPRIPMTVGIQRNGFFRTEDLPEEDVHAEAKLAAQAFRHLDNFYMLRSLVSRQMLIYLSQRDPGFFDSPFGPEDDLTVVNHWKTWLVEEYGEQVAVYAYLLERDIIKQAFYLFVLPVALTFCFFLLQSGGLFIFSILGTLYCFGSFFSRLSMLWRYKGVARNMLAWRAERDT